MFGPQIKLCELIGRYVLVEGDRGVDIGQITAVLKTNVVAHSDISQFGNFDLNYMESQDGNFHVNTIGQFHADAQLDDDEPNNCYVNGVDGKSDDNDDVYRNDSSSLQLSKSRNITNEMH